MFTLDTDSGFRDVVLIKAAYGLGETVVGGQVDPDEFWLFKPTLAGHGRHPQARRRAQGRGSWCLTPDGRPRRGRRRSRRTPAAMSLRDADAVALRAGGRGDRGALHRRRGAPTPMDIEWAKDGPTGELFILQARPETVHAADDRRLSRSSRSRTHGAVRS